MKMATQIFYFFFFPAFFWLSFFFACNLSFTLASLADFTSCRRGGTFGWSEYTKFLIEPRNLGSYITLGSASSVKRELYLQWEKARQNMSGRKKYVKWCNLLCVTWPHNIFAFIVAAPTPVPVSYYLFVGVFFYQISFLMPKLISQRWARNGAIIHCVCTATHCSKCGSNPLPPPPQPISIPDATVNITCFMFALPHY